MELLGYVMLSIGNISRSSNNKASKMSIIGNPGEPTAYGITKTKISVIKSDGILKYDIDDRAVQKIKLMDIRQDGVKQKKMRVAHPNQAKYKVSDLKTTKAPLIKFKPIRANSALAIASGLNIELGRSMSELIEVIKSTESLYIVNKISEKNGRTLWGITRMGAGSISSFEIGSILTIDDTIVRFTPNHELRKNMQYREFVPLTGLNMLTMKSDFRDDGYSSRYIQIIMSIARPMKWAITGVIENSNTSVVIKVQNEIGEYKYSFTLDREEPEFLRLTNVTLVCDLI